MCAILCVIVQCSHELAGGGTIETTNGIAGAILNSDSTPSTHTIVKLFPDDFDPVASGTETSDVVFIDTTDVLGVYHFNNVSSGRYVVVARDNGTALIVRDITVSNDSITNINNAMMKRSGVISTGFLPAEKITDGYLYIPGTDIYAKIGNNGTATLTGVPPGIHHSILLSSEGFKKYNILRNDITLRAGDSVTVEMPLCKYTLGMQLNTSATGAHITGTVTGFPLLVRLNKGNFDFTTARTDGSDLVFIGNKGAVLPYQIERWDAFGKRAEIWVKIDSIHGDDSTQPIRMFWGNSLYSQELPAFSVFDTSEGYQGIWHLGENSSEPARDATINHFDGDSPDGERPLSAEGIIGRCRWFDGKSSYFTMQNTAESKLNIPSNKNYTVSAWAYLDTLDELSHCILTKGIEQYYLQSTYNSLNTPSIVPLWEFLEFNNAVSVDVPTFPAVSGTWVFLTGMRQGNRQLLYCNGELVDSVITSPPNSGSQTTLNDLFIGRFASTIHGTTNEGYCYFKGGIDEVRFISTAKNSDWIKLCYMNQRSDDRLVVFKP
jgi:hypothetical protein